MTTPIYFTPMDQLKKSCLVTGMIH